MITFVVDEDVVEDVDVEEDEESSTRPRCSLGRVAALGSNRFGDLSRPRTGRVGSGNHIGPRTQAVDVVVAASSVVELVVTVTPADLTPFLSKPAKR